MVHSVVSGKTTKRGVRNGVFLLALGFAVLVYVVTPLTTFAVCPNKKPAQKTAQQKMKRQVKTNRVAILQQLAKKLALFLCQGYLNFNPVSTSLLTSVR